ncbi:MAG: hypothetical protein JXQ67_03270 [Campylobacterales bacterium]|nr:hypothetical protein [Campylobacterales bacterium]
MKTILLISVFILSCSLSANELAWVDEQIEAIKPPRSGINSKTLASLNNPFIYLKKKDEPVKNTTTAAHTNSLSNTKNLSTKSVTQGKNVMSLSLVVNSSAMINDSWYKKGDTINGYTVNEITPKSVLLVKKKKQLLLSTKSSTKNIKFNTK